ncbi:MAG: hypothetical protein A2201_08000, partial [Alicyclobacillus sp. RIFOXYA1_FULL_53_8]
TVLGVGKHAVVPVDQTPHSSAAAPESSINQGFGLLAAPVNVSAPSPGDGPIYPPGSYVLASLTNIGTMNVTDANAFGILYFTPKGSLATTWQASDSATFVHVLDNPTTGIAPGQSIMWKFHPVGVPHGANGRLDEIPHLQFFQAGLVDLSKADFLWPRASVTTHLQSVTTQILASGNGQSVHVRLTVGNPTQKPVKLHDLWFIIWFSLNPSSNFSDPNAVRFLDYVPAAQQGLVLQPGGQVSVELREVGAVDTKFAALTPHIAVTSR